MPRSVIMKRTEILRSPRVKQLEGMFDIPEAKYSEASWAIDFELPKQWNIGLIVGPSGSGKTTVAREVFGQYMSQEALWESNKSIVDSFPKSMGIKDIVALLSSVGFSSPPSWLKPYDVLSNGEKFRVDIARTLAESNGVVVVDEYTSVVDRTVAQIASAAIQKTIRERDMQFVAVSCHYDIVDWLEPDWIYEPHTNRFTTGRSLHQRPKIELKIQRCHHSAWQLFRKHHYLNTEINKAAICFVALWDDVPVAFSSWLPFVHSQKKNTKREHRTVTLPDYQGVGIGNAVSNYCCSMWRGLGYDAISTTSHPAMIKSRNKSPLWKITKKAIMTSRGGNGKRGGRVFKAARSSDRITYAFEYIGAALDKKEAERVLGV